MMGQQGGMQDRLFYSFNLDDHVPSNHLLRGIDRFFDLGDLRQHLAPYYSHTGRPSIDPELMVRMLIVGYCFGIRSERRLCEEIHLNLAYRWFCRLGLEDPIPDHSTFSKNRHGRFRDSGALRYVFETVLRRCMTEGLVQGEGFAVDASIIKADANRSKGVAGTETVDWSKGEGPSRAVREYLAALDEVNQTKDDTAPAAEPATAPKSISLTDPASRWTAAPGGPAFFAYSTNYLIDLHAGIILDVEATPAHRTAEVESAKTMIDRVEERFALKPDRLAGDMAYGTAPMLGWMVEEKAISPHVPVWDKSRRDDGTFPRDDFSWDEQANEYRCPGGNALRSDWRAFVNPRTHVTKADTVIYRASQHDCGGCPMKNQCCPNMPFRKIARSVHENARDVARKLVGTAEYKQSRRDRKKVEMLFAHLKRILKLDRLRLRGLTGAQDEFLLAATAQNLRRMAKRLMPLGEDRDAMAT
ncbi:IS1182 family transposase [Cupriavidus pauculus]|uniref:IS5/IS1182 family transposase n=1 Tax=Cupriavidus pauculus TaxID=82633 RepID=A0A2N5C720_9BURK|nr:IS1182 family transposase [Cupriavidus pauculus]PLP98026.1 IS5/IS1182 family transposase [Cupriavidus pauculus]